MTLLLGAHMPIAKGLDTAVANGRAIGCSVVQVFTSSPHRWHSRQLSDSEASAFRDANARMMAGPPVAHDSYLINLAAADPDLLQKSRRAFLEEIRRCEQLGIATLVTHMGSYKESTEEDGLIRLVESLNLILSETSGSPVTIALETTAGQGNYLGSRFEHFPWIFEHVEHHHRLKVCFDTCHVFAAGYDIRTDEAYSATLAEFADVVGLERLCAFHLNDCKRELGSRVDRHEHIGHGQLGETPFRLLLEDDRFAALPKIIETPDPERMHAYNIAKLKSLVGLCPTPAYPEEEIAS
ncbi:MAG: deoxyribonuclease IV [Armatimonadota bacterium]